MQPLFGSETDGDSREKIGETSIKKEKNYVYFDRTLRVDLSFAEYRI